VTVFADAGNERSEARGAERRKNPYPAAKNPRTIVRGFYFFTINSSFFTKNTSSEVFFIYLEPYPFICYNTYINLRGGCKMKKIKSIIAILLVCALVFSVASCGKDTTDETTTTTEQYIAPNETVTYSMRFTHA
jgi:hypothetical protein